MGDSDRRTDPEGIPVLGASDFEPMLRESGVPVLVDFFATWCGPCQWIVPTLERLAARYGERIRIVKVDVDAAPTLAERYRIASVPTLLLFENGSETGRSVGVEPARVEAMAREAIEGGADAEGRRSSA